MAVKDRRERERQIIRALILDEARRLFATHGYEAVTMRSIANNIEYSPTTIYSHFKDKESLIQELCSQDCMVLAQRFVQVASIKDPIERLKQLGRVYVDFAVTHPNHYRLLFMTPRTGELCDNDKERKGNPQQDAYAFLKMTVQDCLQANCFLDHLKDLELISQTIWAGVHGVVSLFITMKDDPWVEWRDLEQRAGLMSDVLIRGLCKDTAHG
jgi:AcrR family transcriptional regulator